jgi:hypothetical protein
MTRIEILQSQIEICEKNGWENLKEGYSNELLELEANKTLKTLKNENR